MCDIFISYRRTLGTKYREPLCNKECEIQKERLSLTSLPVGSYAARILYDYLTSKNFSVFYDKESINFGEKYREKIKEEINQKARVFILVLTKNIFDRYYDEEDHLYTEIKYALSKAEKHPNSIIIVPFIPDRMFDFKKDFNVSNEFSYLKDIEQYNAQRVDFAEVTFRDSMDRFCKQLEEILVPIYQDRFIDAKRREIATIDGDSTHSKLTKKILKALGL